MVGTSRSKIERDGESVSYVNGVFLEKSGKKVER